MCLWRGSKVRETLILREPNSWEVLSSRMPPDRRQPHSLPAWICRSPAEPQPWIPKGIRWASNTGSHRANPSLSEPPPNPAWQRGHADLLHAAAIWQRSSVDSGSVISIAESFPLDFILIIKRYRGSRRLLDSGPSPLLHAAFFSRRTCDLAPGVCAKIMVCFHLSRSQSRKFRPPGSSRSRWEFFTESHSCHSESTNFF